jgi:hypothetical protein
MSQYSQCLTLIIIIISRTLVNTIKRRAAVPLSESCVSKKQAFI